jgi:hypothetical protein
LGDPACAKPGTPQLVVIATVLYRLMLQWIRVAMVIYLEVVGLFCGLPAFGGLPLVEIVSIGA